MLTDKIDPKIIEAIDFQEEPNLLWTTTGSWEAGGFFQRLWGMISRKKVDESLYYSNYCPTKEEAEAYSYRDLVEGWIPNHDPFSKTLYEAIAEARNYGRRGVIVRSFREGKWVTLARYEVSDVIPSDK